MPKLVIDNIEVEVPAGTNVLEAAKKAGIVIPHFCYHPALGSVGACRLCAMKFIDGPVKGVQVSCMITAQDGMVVSTTDGEAARLRRTVIEWLMMNHPHDCPVCDEGGMCLLQDYTVSGGHSVRRYKGKKRVFADQYLGEFIYHEMNRCIQCYRCSRFYQDYAGGEDFGPMQIANKVYFGRFREGWLESPFSGNLAEVCPTGVFTDKTYRFKSRLWELETAPSVCPHCSLGCNTIPGAKLREVVRVTARENQDVNGWFICDRGRFGYGFMSRMDRPSTPMVDGHATGFDEALLAAEELIVEAQGMHGRDAVAFMGSPRASVETNFAVRNLARAAGSEYVCYSPDPLRERKDRRAAHRLDPDISRSLMDVGRSELIVAAGVDPIGEAPMLALMMRQAVRNGAKVIVIDPRPVSLPFAFTHLPVPGEELAGALTDTLAHEASNAGSITIVAGTDVGDEALIDKATDETARLKSTGKDCGLLYVMHGPDSYGTALMAGDGGDFDDILDGMEKGRIKTLVVVESDPIGFYPDVFMLDAALNKLDALIVLDHLPTETARRADVFIPSNAYAEGEGIFVNNEGRAQAFGRVCASGIPVNRMGPEAHPPRAFFADVPGASRPAWQLAFELAALLKPDQPVYGSVSELRTEMSVIEHAFKPLAGLTPNTPGVILEPADPYVPPVMPTEMNASSAGFKLIVCDTTFGTEELSSYSEKTLLRLPEPYIIICTEDAATLGLKDSMRVAVRWNARTLFLDLVVKDGVAKGIAVMPKLPSLRTAGFAGKHVTISRIA